MMKPWLLALHYAYNYVCARVTRVYNNNKLRVRMYIIMCAYVYNYVCVGYVYNYVCVCV